MAICTYCKQEEEIHIEFIENEPCCKDCFYDKGLRYSELMEER